MELNTLDQAWALIIPGETDYREFLASGQVLVHYTKVATKVLGSEELWLRNARNMDDQDEIKLGRECVNAFLNDRADVLEYALVAICPGLNADLTGLWQAEHSAQIDQSFIACFTTQDADNNRGSRYHWERYGDVALCLNPAFLSKETSQLSLNLVKAKYGEKVVKAGLEELLTALQTHRKLFQRVDQNVLLSFLRHRLFFDSVASKSERFAGESEWRLIHAPFLFASAHLRPRQEIFKGNLEEIYPLKLETPIGTGIATLEIRNLVRKVLIQPKLGGQTNQLRLDLISRLVYHHVPAAAERVLLVAADGAS